ncbi:TadE family type IV pilus minor pilin [Ornithinimicrobium sp. Y1694]|uniref:TadE family type IV pilus minor pilin n=1 Tax=Ornithinimicrobium sp. Y1694 TaxID=3418590 RepID=UPI003CF247A9
MASAELALALPAVILVLALALTGLTLGIDQVRCEDAARVAARAASRGEPSETVVALATSRAPEGSEVVMTGISGSVFVEVRAPARNRHLRFLPAATATAEAVLEPGAHK